MDLYIIVVEYGFVVMINLIYVLYISLVIYVLYISLVIYIRVIYHMQFGKD